MEITFYYAPMSSAVPVASVLAELGVPHQKVTFDLAKGDQKSPEFLRLNPNGKVPTLVVDGTPMFEALAIMQWLGDEFGAKKGLWPAFHAPERLTATAWSTWAYVSYGSAVARLYVSSSDVFPKELKHSAAADFARTELQQMLSVLDGHLAKTGFIAGDRFSVADLIVSGVVLWSTMVGVSTADHFQVSKWLDSCRSRPSVKQEWGG